MVTIDKLQGWISRHKGGNGRKSGVWRQLDTHTAYRSREGVVWIYPFSGWESVVARCQLQNVGLYCVWFGSQYKM